MVGEEEEKRREAEGKKRMEGECFFVRFEDSRLLGRASVASPKLLIADDVLKRSRT